MLETGKGVDQNVQSAADWYKAAAQQDYQPAVVYLGYLYSVGKGVDQNSKEAFKWYSRGAQMGNPVAQNNLAVILLHGIPYKENKPLAAQWFLQAAMQGNIHAQYSLATMYMTGTGIKKNVCESMKWYEKAASQNYIHAQAVLAQMYRKGECAESSGMKQAVEWMRRAAEQGHVRSQTALGRMYESGEAGESYTLDDAVPWYLRAADEGGDVRAMYKLASLYESGPDKLGRGLPFDRAKSLEWYTMAANKDYAPAIATLGRLHEEGGLGLKADADVAFKYYTKAADRGNPFAMFRLVGFYLKGAPPLKRQNKVRAYELCVSLHDILRQNAIQEDNSVFRTPVADCVALVREFKRMKMLNDDVGDFPPWPSLRQK